METAVPLLGDPKFAKALGTIDDIRADCSSGKTAKAEAKMMRTFLVNKRPSTDPVVLSRLLSVTHTYFPDKFAEIRNDMLTNTALFSPLAVLSAVDMTLDDGDLETASTLFSQIERIDSICRHEYVHGRICQMKGDAAEAREHYMAAFRADIYFKQIYIRLHSLEPDYGWDHVMELISLRQGSDMTPRPDLDTKLADLSAIYSGWLRGDRSNSMSAMTSSEAFASKDPFYMMVYAWMCVSDGSYRNAVRSYADAVKGFGGNVVLQTEMAYIQDCMGESADSEDACLRALETDPNSDKATAQLAIARLHQGRLRDSVLTVDDLIKLPVVDARECARCIDALWEAGRRTEANQLFKRIGSRCSDTAYECYLLARNDNLNESYRSAEKSASRGIKEDPDSIPCICQLALALSGQGRTANALRLLREKRQIFGDEIRLLETEKDVLIKAENYDDAIDICDYILDITPRNADVMKDKANAYRLKGDYVMAVACYRESLNIREDLRLFIGVLKMLLESRRTEDLCRLIDDFDDTYGSSATVWRIRGNAEYIEGMYEEAAASYTRATEIVNNDLELWHSKGMAEEKAGLYADAEASYDRAVILDLENADCWISKAVVQELRGNIQGAIDSLNRVISVNADNAYALAMKGRLMARLGMYREALFFLELSYRLDSSNPVLLEMMLKILMHQNETARAIRVGNAVLEKDRQNYGTMLIMAEIYIDTGDSASALKMLNDARPYISEDPKAAAKCAELYGRVLAFSDEIEIYRSLTEKYPDSRDYLMKLAESYSAAGDKESAAEVYGRLERMEPEDVEISVKKVIAESEDDEIEMPEQEDTYALAKTLMEGGRTSEGLDLLVKSLDSCPDDVEQYLYTADALAGNGRPEQSVEVLEKAMAAFPHDPRIFYAKGSVLESQGNRTDALSAYNEAARLGMANHDLFAATGRLTMEMGMISPAIESLSKAVAEDPSDGRSRKDLCIALMKADRSDEAVPHITALLRESPNDAELLRMYVTAVDGRAESVLSVYDNILDAERSEEDTEFFAAALESIGEHDKAEALRPTVPDVSDAHKEALDILDRAYSQGIDISDRSLYEGYGEEHMGEILDILTTHTQYEPDPGSDEFDEMERLSRDVIVGQEIRSIEINREVPIQIIRHATGCDSVEKMYRIQSHILQAFDIDCVPEGCEEGTDELIASLKDPPSATLYDIMDELDIGVMTARLVLNRIRQ